MRTSDRWKLLTLAAQLWWLGLQAERQRNRLQRAVEHGMAMSDPALVSMSTPFQHLCVQHWILERDYMQTRCSLLLRQVQHNRVA